MPRAQNGVGRRYKKRRTSPASAIEVEQIEEAGVEEMVVVEGGTEEVAEIAIVDHTPGAGRVITELKFRRSQADRAARPIAQIGLAIGMRAGR